MCGIFGVISEDSIDPQNLNTILKHSEQRGRDSSGLFFFTSSGDYSLYRASRAITALMDSAKPAFRRFLIGHSRLITNGLSDNQPVFRDSIVVIHNGIVVNHEELWGKVSGKRQQEIDSEIIAAIAADVIGSTGRVEEVPAAVVGMCKGIVACAIAFPKLGKACLFSNNGSLYYGTIGQASYFASERYPLEKIGCQGIEQVREQGIVVDIPTSTAEPALKEFDSHTRNLIPGLGTHKAEEAMLEHRNVSTLRCSRCILPATMPFIRFDSDGVCNYCHHYRRRNVPKPVSEFMKLVEPYRRESGGECIVPFSGGRDSCYGLHLIAKELKLRPITYTYDWGMVTDLARRNISRMCQILGIENIIVADDISQKRNYISKNLEAWLKSPNLGMISILTSGDKHFFRHIETVKAQTGIALNLWGVNPLEVTHFKAGFLGVPPDFEEQRVYSHGAMKQLRYQWLRFKAMLESPGYFNASLWDTLYGEYYRSFFKRSDYFHVFDYWRWDEDTINKTLINEYDWECAPDTNSTWRIGDGTAAFYNYIYYSVAGFTEHDTFRSNQIREGDLTRDQALALVQDENRPRYPNIKWYLDAVGVDFSHAISTINSIPKLYA
jgi:glucosamine--fructose-6-phosphate aminotransferase (isomerizing)